MKRASFLTRAVSASAAVGFGLFAALADCQAQSPSYPVVSSYGYFLHPQGAHAAQTAPFVAAASTDFRALAESGRIDLQPGSAVAQGQTPPAAAAFPARALGGPSPPSPSSEPPLPFQQKVLQMQLMQQQRLQQSKENAAPGLSLEFLRFQPREAGEAYSAASLKSKGGIGDGLGWSASDGAGGGASDILFAKPEPLSEWTAVQRREPSSFSTMNSSFPRPAVPVGGGVHSSVFQTHEASNAASLSSSALHADVALKSHPPSPPPLPEARNRKSDHSAALTSFQHSRQTAKYVQEREREAAAAKGSEEGIAWRGTDDGGVAALVVADSSLVQGACLTPLPEGDPRLPCGTAIPGVSALVRVLSEGPPWTRESLEKERGRLRDAVESVCGQLKGRGAQRLKRLQPPLLIPRRFCCNVGAENFKDAEAAALQKQVESLTKKLLETERRLAPRRPAVLLSTPTYASFAQPVEFLDFLLKRSAVLAASSSPLEDSCGSNEDWGIGLVDTYRKKRATEEAIDLLLKTEAFFREGVARGLYAESTKFVFFANSRASEFATIASLALGTDGSGTNSSRQAPPLVGAFVNMAGELNSSSRVKRRASVKPPFHAVDFVFKRGPRGVRAVRMDFIAKVIVPPGEETAHETGLPASLRMQVGLEIGWHLRNALDSYLESGALDGLTGKCAEEEAFGAARGFSSGAFCSQVPVFFVKLAAVKRVVDFHAKEPRLLGVDAVRASAPLVHQDLGVPIVFYLSSVGAAAQAYVLGYLKSAGFLGILRQTVQDLRAQGIVHQPALAGFVGALRDDLRRLYAWLQVEGPSSALTRTVRKLLDLFKGSVEQARRSSEACMEALETLKLPEQSPLAAFGFLYCQLYPQTDFMSTAASSELEFYSLHVGIVLQRLLGADGKPLSPSPVHPAVKAQAELAGFVEERGGGDLFNSTFLEAPAFSEESSLERRRLQAEDDDSESSGEEPASEEDLDRTSSQEGSSPELSGAIQSLNADANEAGNQLEKDALRAPLLLSADFGFPSLDEASHVEDAQRRERGEGTPATGAVSADTRNASSLPLSATAELAGASKSPAQEMAELGNGEAEAEQRLTSAGQVTSISSENAQYATALDSLEEAFPSLGRFKAAEGKDGVESQVSVLGQGSQEVDASGDNREDKQQPQLQKSSPNLQRESPASHLSREQTGTGAAPLGRLSANPAAEPQTPPFHSAKAEASTFDWAKSVSNAAAVDLDKGPRPHQKGASLVKGENPLASIRHRVLLGSAVPPSEATPDLMAEVPAFEGINKLRAGDKLIQDRLEGRIGRKGGHRRHPAGPVRARDLHYFMVKRYPALWLNLCGMLLRGTTLDDLVAVAQWRVTRSEKPLVLPARQVVFYADEPFSSLRMAPLAGDGESLHEFPLEGSSSQWQRALDGFRSFREFYGED